MAAWQSAPSFACAVLFACITLAVFRPRSREAESLRSDSRSAELIGTDAASSDRADCEILTMAAEGLINAGVRDFSIGLSDVRLLSAILDAAGAEGDVREGIWSALAERDYVLYGELVSSLKNIAEGSQNGLGIDLLECLLNLQSTAEALDALRAAGSPMRLLVSSVYWRPWRIEAWASTFVWICP